MELQPIYAGVLASVLSEALKFVPFLSKNDLTKALTALAVAFLGSYLLSDVKDFPTVLLTSFVTYKSLVQPAAKVAGIKTQP